MSSTNGHAVAVVEPPITEERVEHLTHFFRPRDAAQPWGLCGVCGFAQSSHVDTEVPYVSIAPRAA